MILEAYSAERYNKSNCSAGRFCSGSDYIQFYDKSDELRPDDRDVGSNIAGSYLI